MITTPEQLAECFAALGHLTRQHLYAALTEYSPASLSYLSARITNSTGNTSHHLKIMTTCGLLKRQQVGEFSSFSIDTNVARQMEMFLASSQPKKVSPS